jgi:hypothetical protein
MIKISKWRAIIAVAALITPIASFADEPNTPTSPTISTLESLRSEIALLKVKLELAKLQSEMVQSGDKSIDTPHVVSIWGVSPNATAKIATTNNDRVDVHEGTMIHGGYKVISISGTTGVIVKKGNKTQELPFDSGNNNTALSAQPAQPGMQSMPLGMPR